LSATNLALSHPGLNPDLRGKKPASSTRKEASCLYLNKKAKKGVKSSSLQLLVNVFEEGTTSDEIRARDLLGK
jgi:hypothetical protein